MSGDENMMRDVLGIVSILILGSSLAASARAQSQQPAADPEEALSVYTVPKDYHYGAHGRRDPFVNPVPKPQPGQAAAPSATRPPGLKGVLLAEAKIAGVVTSREPVMNVVIISAPGARAAYFARVGDHLFDAVVKSIKLDTVTFALTTRPADPTAPREIVRKVRPTPGENR
jgi:hypothetical protein